MPSDLLTRSIKVEPSVAQAVHASELNITTQRLTGTYDISIGTNVLLYFERPNLTLALCKTAAMARTAPTLCITTYGLRQRRMQTWSASRCCRRAVSWSRRDAARLFTIRSR